uniref:Uncharacterized protein n=1 Tax=Fagus sylvatica TaxID=28930 RepID=A0A2N9I4H4_FAGSY
MANIPGNSADPVAGAMPMGDRVNNQFVNVVNYPSTTEWGSDSNFAAMRRRQHHRRYLRSSIVKPSVFPPPQPIPSPPPPPPEPRIQSLPPITSLD